MSFICDLWRILLLFRRKGMKQWTLYIFDVSEEYVDKRNSTSSHIKIYASLYFSTEFPYNRGQRVAFVVEWHILIS